MSTVDLSAALLLAVQAAAKATCLVQEAYTKRFTHVALDLGIEQKTDSMDLVTTYDKRCEEAIMATLRGPSVPESLRSIKIISEEFNPNEVLTDDPTWIIDPIDGTMSFVHGNMDLSIAIGLSIGKKAVLGVSSCPCVGRLDYKEDPWDYMPCAASLKSMGAWKVGEMVYGAQGLGVFVNGQPVPKVRGGVPNAKPLPLGRAAVAFNMPWRHSQVAIDASLAIRSELVGKHQVQAMRSFGSAVFQLTQVVLGRLDCYMEVGGKIWDCCAGAALLVEVGGTMLELEGGVFTLEDHTFVAACTRSLAEDAAAICKAHNYKKLYWM